MDRQWPSRRNRHDIPATGLKGSAMLTDAQRVAYERDGFIVVPDVFSPAEIDELRLVTNEFVAGAARVTANDDIYDLEDSHTPQEPHLIHPAYFRASRN